MCIYVQCVYKPTKSANRKQESDGSKNATHNMVYLYDACVQISDFCQQQLLRKMRRKISWTDGRMDRGRTVYPSPPLGSGVIKIKHRNKNQFLDLKPTPLDTQKKILTMILSFSMEFSKWFSYDSQFICKIYFLVLQIINGKKTWTLFQHDKITPVKEFVFGYQFPQ